MGIAVDVVDRTFVPAGVEYEFILCDGCSNVADGLRGIDEGRYDVLAAGATLTPTRAQHFIPTLGYYKAEYKMLVHSDGFYPPENSRIDGVFRPFTAGTWLCILAYHVICGILTYVFEKGNNPTFQAVPSDRTQGHQQGRHLASCGGKQLGMDSSAKVNTVFWVVSNFVGVGSPYPPVTLPCKILWTGRVVINMIIVTGYTASLANFMLTTSAVGVTSGPDDLQQ